MFVQVIHNISDKGAWAQRLADFAKQGPPPEFTLLSSGTAADGTKAFCLWEAQSVDALSTFLNAATAGAAQNIYYTIDENAPATIIPRSAAAR
jgi:hypothetical protein